jgi:hypothetical protein
LRTPGAGQQTWPARKADRESPPVSKETSILFHQFNVHAEIAALTDERIRTRLAARGMTEVRCARRIAMQVRRKQMRELGL